GVGMWVAHYAFHFLMGFWTIIPVVRSLIAELGLPFAWLPRTGLGPLVPQPFIYPLELGCLGLGGALALRTAWQIAGRTNATRQRQLFWPWAIVILILVAAAIWLIGQPMDMRGTING
ncbi:MAG TPA: hypothetical protein VGE07_03745, partial [Herpetosiphonaceae bacterium]